MPPRQRIGAETKARALAMIERGLYDAEIADKLGLDRKAVANIRNHLPSPHQGNRGERLLCKGCRLTFHKLNKDGLCPACEICPVRYRARQEA